MNNANSSHTPSTAPNSSPQPDISPRQQAKETGRSFLFLITFLVLLSAFGSFVNDMYLPTLPAMQRAFHCSVSTVQLGLTFGMIGLGLGQLTFGPISDKYGRKPILIGSLALFSIASVVSVYSPTIHFFLICRLLQGIGASGGYFLARTIPADLYGGRQLAKVMALIGAINGFAPASAPVLGGLVAKSLGWQGIFWILFGFSSLLLIMTPRFKESLSKDNRYKGRLIDSFKEYKLLLSNRRFMTHVMLKGSALGILFAYISAAPFIFQNHFHYTALQFGLFMGVNALFVAVGSTLALKFRPLKRASFVGSLLVLASIVALTIVLCSGKDFWVMEILFAPMLLGLGMNFTVGNTLAMNEGRANAGGASAVIGLIGYIFGAVVAPLVGLGNVLHSTAVTLLILSFLLLLFATLSRRLPADLQN